MKSRWSSCGATSIPGWASWPPESATRSCWRWRGSSASGATTRSTAGSANSCRAPGEPGRISARARAPIAAADGIVYDRLIPPGALDGARQDAELIYAGKEGGGPSMSQAEIDRLLVSQGSAARTVVRLKGGDPFVF